MLQQGNLNRTTASMADTSNLASPTPQLSVVNGKKSSTTAVVSLQMEPSAEPPMRRDWRFWCIIMSLEICMLLTAVDFVRTAVGETALIPFCGGLAQSRNPRCNNPVLSWKYTVRSRDNDELPDWWKEPRIIQWLDGAAIGGGAGPVIGGALAQRGQWRWLFYLNGPVCSLAAIFVGLFLRLKKPNMPLREKLKRIARIGNFIICASTTSMVIALTWGGVHWQFPWTSPKVLATLVLGGLGLTGFLVYEATFPE
ncbi:hypothetical protein DFH06DRAFT_1448299 [Mycena polygramma]|nr:hypothetical protein DFH06DRAFT_1448299 [Mycena polygramma]